MPAPTVAVTVKLSSLIGEAIAGATVKAKLDRYEVYQQFVIADDVTGTTDVNGDCVLNLFPNALPTNDPAGLGSQGSVYYVTATGTGGKKLNVQAIIPNQACNLHDVLVAEEPSAPSTGEIVGAVRYNIAQTLTTPQQVQARTNIGFDAAVRAVALTGLSLATATAIAATDTTLVAFGKAQAQITALDTAKANLAGAAFTGAVSATSFTGPLTGNVTGNVSGNAGTVTNGVYTSGSYADPSWITSLAGSKISGNIAGNAATATVLATARNINGVSFNGSADITVTAAAGTLTGATLAAGVTASSLTSVGTLTALTVTGSVGVGGAAFASAKLMLTGTAPASGTLSFGHYNGLTLDPAVTSSAYLNYTVPAIATGGTVGTLAHYFVAQGVFTGTATNQYGFAVGSTMTGATNNFGFHSAIASGSGRWNFYAAGTAANYFAGATTFSDTLTVSGTSTLGITRVSGADNSLQFGVSGATRGVRFITSSFGSAIEGVDNTLVASYQPLVITGSTLTLTSSATDKVDIATNAGAQIQLRVNHTANSVNIIQATGGATGAGPSFSVGGSDANIPFAYYTKGSGSHLFFANSGLQMLVGATASSVNYWQFFGAATTGALNMYADGADTNISVVQNTKGSGSHFFRTNGGTATQFTVTHTASAVDYFTVTGSSAGAPVLSVAGASANVAAVYATKGTAQHLFATNGTAAVQLSISHTASAVNYWNLSGAATGGLLTFTTQGSDTNIGAYLATKGSGSWRFATDGGDQFRIIHAASAVNYWAAYGGATGFGPIFYADGTDAGVNANYSLKGGGEHVFYTGSTNFVQATVHHTANSVNWLRFTGGATGNAVTISTAGTDANRSISLTAAGTGLVQITNDSLRIVTSKTPASAAATGTQGQVAWDASYVYVCTATNTWKRAAIATW